MVWNRSYINKYNIVIRFLKFSTTERYVKFRFDLLKKNYKNTSIVVLRKRWKKFKKYNLFNYIKLQKLEAAYWSKFRSLAKIKFFYNRVDYFMINLKSISKVEKFVNLVASNPKIWTYSVFLIKPFVLKPNILLTYKKPQFKTYRFINSKRWFVPETKELYTLAYNYINLINYYITLQQLKEVYKLNVLLKLINKYVNKT